MKIISHRGASGYAPENTLAAFALAVKMGSRNFEFDVHLTRDGRLVVHHDYDLKRTAGRDLRIADLDCAGLKKFNVGNKFGYPFERVPLLSEVMDVISPSAEWLNFELKNDGNVYPGIEKKLIEFLAARPGIYAKSLLSSFDYGALKRLRALDKGVKLGYLGHDLKAALLLPAMYRAISVSAVNFHMHLRLANRIHTAVIHKAGMKVCVYTVNRREDALKMERIGVDGIFSNYPDILTKQRTENRE